MFKFKNPLVSFLILGISVALFIVLFALLLKILIFGFLIGFILFLFFWLKQKLFPTRNKFDEQIKQFMDSMNQKSNHASRDQYSSSHHGYYRHDSRTNINKTDAATEGRIIDVDPEEK
jgi:predicted lipid-binding transport protein (Tim44 family)